MVVQSPRLDTGGLVLWVGVGCFGLAPYFSSSNIKSLKDITTELTGGLPLKHIIIKLTCYWSYIILWHVSMFSINTSCVGKYLCERLPGYSTRVINVQEELTYHPLHTDFARLDSVGGDCTWSWWCNCNSNWCLACRLFSLFDILGFFLADADLKIKPNIRKCYHWCVNRKKQNISNSSPRNRHSQKQSEIK